MAFGRAVPPCLVAGLCMDWGIWVWNRKVFYFGDDDDDDAFATKDTHKAT